MAENVASSEELLRCQICAAYITAKQGFTCPRCKRGPICTKHRVSGKKECSSCVLEVKHAELLGLKKQEHDIEAFLRLLQFIFLVFAVFFVATKAGLTESIDFLHDNVVTEHPSFFGILPVVGYLLFYLILYNQRKRINEKKDYMKTIERARILK